MLFIPSSSLEEGIDCIKLTFSQSFLTLNTQIKGRLHNFLSSVYSVFKMNLVTNK
ncbi:hypothetical protein HMPREF0973_02618 [Prevotella veroralis F0319]|uniref:Uncharacterized protein n=1 Tax=Prevotella veroralis F0319 TaxID=649761 RepID=C9MSJ9_9BACT|nr:hypothetical protein HMPREF0973_02618 [Prevotella veroralis F0319]